MPTNRSGRVFMLVATAATVSASLFLHDGASARPSRPTDDTELIAKTFEWSIDDARAHIDAQHRFGTLVHTIATEFTASFTGAEFAEIPGATSTIYIAGKAPSAVERLVADAGLPVELVEGGKYTSDDLDRRSVQLVDAFAEIGLEAGAAVMPDGQIQVAVNSDPKLATKLPAELLDAVDVVEAPGTIARDEDVTGGVLVYATGGGSCTSGFSVRSRATGTTGVSTAGHCTGINRFSIPGPNNDVALSHQAQHIGTFGDVEWKTSPDVEVPRYMASPAEERDVDVVWPANGYAVDMITCVHSRVNGTRTCDRIYSTSVTSGNASNLIATDNDNTSPGDSGGPWSFNTIADGGHKGDLWIWFGWRNVFTKADLFDEAIGVDVITT